MLERKPKSLSASRNVQPPRCLIHKIIPDRKSKTGKNSTDYVERLFTYATPHGGIEFDLGL